MPDRRERRCVRRGADFLGRRVGRYELAVRLLDGAQFPHQRVVLGVRDLGIIELVIAEVVVLDLLSQVGSSRSRIAFGHKSRSYAPIVSLLLVACSRMRSPSLAVRT